MDKMMSRRVPHPYKDPLQGTRSVLLKLAPTYPKKCVSLGLLGAAMGLDETPSTLAIDAVVGLTKDRAMWEAPYPLSLTLPRLRGQASVRDLCLEVLASSYKKACQARPMLSFILYRVLFILCEISEWERRAANLLRVLEQSSNEAKARVCLVRHAVDERRSITTGIPSRFGTLHLAPILPTVLSDVSRLVVYERTEELVLALSRGIIRPSCAARGKRLNSRGCDEVALASLIHCLCAVSVRCGAFENLIVLPLVFPDLASPPGSSSWSKKSCWWPTQRLRGQALEATGHLSAAEKVYRYCDIRDRSSDLLAVEAAGLPFFSSGPHLHLPCGSGIRSISEVHLCGFSSVGRRSRGRGCSGGLGWRRQSGMGCNTRLVVLAEAQLSSCVGDGDEGYGESMSSSSFSSRLILLTSDCDTSGQANDCWRRHNLPTEASSWSSVTVIRDFSSTEFAVLPGIHPEKSQGHASAVKGGAERYREGHVPLRAQGGDGVCGNKGRGAEVHGLGDMVGVEAGHLDGNTLKRDCPTMSPPPLSLWACDRRSLAWRRVKTYPSRKKGPTAAELVGAQVAQVGRVAVVIPATHATRPASTRNGQRGRGCMDRPGAQEEGWKVSRTAAHRPLRKSRAFALDLDTYEFALVDRPMTEGGTPQHVACEPAYHGPAGSEGCSVCMKPQDCPCHSCCSCASSHPQSGLAVATGSGHRACVIFLRPSHTPSPAPASVTDSPQGGQEGASLALPPSAGVEAGGDIHGPPSPCPPPPVVVDLLQPALVAPWEGQQWRWRLDVPIPVPTAATPPLCPTSPASTPTLGEAFAICAAQGGEDMPTLARGGTALTLGKGLDTVLVLGRKWGGSSEKTGLDALTLPGRRWHRPHIHNSEILPPMEWASSVWDPPSDLAWVVSVDPEGRFLRVHCLHRASRVAEGLQKAPFESTAASAAEGGAPALGMTSILGEAVGNGGYAYKTEGAGTSPQAGESEDPLPQHGGHGIGSVGGNSLPVPSSQLHSAFDPCSERDGYRDETVLHPERKLRRTGSKRKRVRWGSVEIEPATQGPCYPPRSGLTCWMRGAGELAKACARGGLRAGSA